MSLPRHPGREALRAHGWLAAHRWLLARRAVQLGLLGLFALGPLAGVWVVKGTLSSSLTLGVLPLTDPLVVLQSLAAGHWPARQALIGAALVALLYALAGGRSYCAWVCPVNLVTDAAAWLRRRLDIPPGWQPPRRTRYWLLAATLAVSALTGVVAWEYVNPITLLHRALLFGAGLAWTVIGAVFVLDLLVSRRGWCGRLCPVGALYGLLGAAAPLRVRADRRARCDDCLDCVAVCPEPHILMPVLKGEARGIPPVIASLDCSSCGRCIDVCAQQVFAFGRRGLPHPRPSRGGEESTLTGGRPGVPATTGR